MDGGWLGWDVHDEGGVVTLRPSTRQSVLNVVVALVGLAAAVGVFTNTPLPGPSPLPFVLIGFPLVTFVNVAYQRWWQPVRFDRPRDEVRRGPRRIGALHELQALEMGATFRAPLQLVFRTPEGGERTVPIPRLTGPLAEQLGQSIAGLLGVAWRSHR
jgi:hypothetical protein